MYKGVVTVYAHGEIQGANRYVFFSLGLVVKASVLNFFNIVGKCCSSFRFSSCTGVGVLVSVQWSTSGQ